MLCQLAIQTGLKGSEQPLMVERHQHQPGDTSDHTCVATPRPRNKTVPTPQKPLLSSNSNFLPPAHSPDCEHHGSVLPTSNPEISGVMSIYSSLTVLFHLFYLTVTV